MGHSQDSAKTIHPLSRWAMIIAAGMIALTVVPILVFPLVGLAMLGAACVRPAVDERKEGWITGLILGSFLLITASVGLTAIIIFWLNSWSWI